jgi:choline-sulfatase/uncharacterized sulfatase
MSENPNILLILADQHHAGLMGCAGHPQVHTPNLDRFAASGVRCTEVYTQNPICTPSRVSILSGQYCHNHGIYGLSGPSPRGLNHLLRHARAHGYRTAAFGKLHLPNRPRNWIADDVDCFGDTYETPEGFIGDSSFLRGLAEKGLLKDEDSFHNLENYGPGPISHDARPSRMPYAETQERWCAREAMAFIDAAPAEPFCIEVAFQRPHHPLLPQPCFWDLYPEDLTLPETIHQDPGGRPVYFQEAYRRFHSRKWDYTDLGESWEDGARRAWRGTLACISQIDDVFGRLMDFLEQRGLTENTIVVYGSDHGAYHGIHGIEEKAPGICSDAVCRVPLLWRGPGIQPGQVCGQLLENVDLTPTLCRLACLPPMDSVDGLDASALLRGDLSAPLREIAVTENPYAKALRWRNYRFVHYPSGMQKEGPEAGELYDLEADPNETQNLYHDPAHQETVQHCRRLLLDWLIQTTRITTVHPAECSLVSDDAPVPVVSGIGGLYDYPVCADGRAPNPVQPRHGGRVNPHYL